MNKELKMLLSCKKCKKPLQQLIDPITKKRSKYLYGCRCNPSLKVSVG